MVEEWTLFLRGSVADRASTIEELLDNALVVLGVIGRVMMLLLFTEGGTVAAVAAVAVVTLLASEAAVRCISRRFT